MNRGFVWKMLLTLIATGSLLPLFVPNLATGFPFTLEARPGIGYVIGKDPDLPLPADLRAGDVLAVDRMTVEARAALIGGNGLSQGLKIPIVVIRDGVPVSLTAEVVVDHGPSATTNRLTNIPLLLSILALALLTLWRGRDWTAWGLTIFSAAICIKNFDIWPADPLPSVWIEMASHLVMWLIAIPGLYITAEALVRSGLPLSIRRLFRAFLVFALLLQMSVSLSKLAGTVFWGWTAWIPYKNLISMLGLLSFFVPLLLLIIGYRRSDGPQRLRIRWVLWSTGLLGATFAGFSFMPRDNLYGLLALPIVQVLCFFGYLYAVLRHRLVDVSFIIDRALVYGLTTSLVVGVFAIIENFVEQAAVGNDASFVIQAGATLVLALVLNRVHRRVEELVDRLFFRRQRRVAIELRRFAKQCAFIERHDQLLKLTAEHIEQVTEGSGVAIYERREGRYLQLIRRGEARFPAAVEVDDLAFVCLRANFLPTDLDDIQGSALGAGGCVFPMALRGTLIGAIVCGARRGEQFAPDEREELTKLAQEVGIALYVLRASKHERFVAAVAAGEMQDPQRTARELQPAISAYDAGLGLR